LISGFWTILVFEVDIMVCRCHKSVGKVFSGWNSLKIMFFFGQMTSYLIFRTSLWCWNLGLHMTCCLPWWATCHLLFFFFLRLASLGFFYPFFLYRLSINLRGENIEPDWVHGPGHEIDELSNNNQDIIFLY
jgi:hypothetical protein